MFSFFFEGTKQNGETLTNVILPPWAKQDPREFIRLHRSALECDYVSQNLHLVSSINEIKTLKMVK